MKGAYDLVLHNYGPDSYMASVHLEVNDTLSVSEFDALSRELQVDVFEKFGIYLSTIGLYSVNTTNTEMMEIREKVKGMVLSDPFIHQMHGFYLDLEKKRMRFDLVISFEAKDRTEVYRKTLDKIQQEFPDFRLSVGMDMDYNECV